MLTFQISQSTSLIIIQINEVFWFRDDLIRIEFNNENAFEQTLKMMRDNGMDGKTTTLTRDCKMALEYIMSNDNKGAKNYVEGIKVENFFFLIFFKLQSACMVKMIFIYLLTMGWGGGGGGEK
jgi:hypothetical protein